MIAFIILFLMIAFYFLPAIIAYNSKKRNAGAILALNILLGWTLIGWVVALIWALAYEAKN
jgi:uncharacterized membrane protein YqaE (UPF0057 family)